MNGVKRFDDVRDGRQYIADFFAKVLRRHDYRQYIAERLAGDFACVMAEALNKKSADYAALEAERDTLRGQIEAMQYALNHILAMQTRGFITLGDNATSIASAALQATPAA